MGKKKGGNLQTAVYTDDSVRKEQNPEVSNYEKGKLVSFSLLFCTVEGEKKKRIKEINCQ